MSTIEITDTELDDLARDAIKAALDDLEHEQMGLGEQLYDKFGEDLPDGSDDALTERFREAIKRQRRGFFDFCPDHKENK